MNAPAFQSGLPLASFTIGGRKKKSGLLAMLRPLCVASEMSFEGEVGDAVGLMTLSPLQALMVMSVRHNSTRRRMKLLLYWGGATGT